MREPLLQEWYDRTNAMFPEIGGWGTLVKVMDWWPWFFFDDAKTQQYEKIQEDLKTRVTDAEVTLKEIFKAYECYKKSKFISSRLSSFLTPVPLLLETKKTHALALNILKEQKYDIVLPRIVQEATIAAFEEIQWHYPNEVGSAIRQLKGCRTTEKIGCGIQEFSTAVQMYTGLVIDPQSLFNEAIKESARVKGKIQRLLPECKRRIPVESSKLIPIFKKIQLEQIPKFADKFLPVVKKLPTYKVESFHMDLAPACCMQAAEVSPGNVVLVTTKDKISADDLSPLVLHEGDPGHAFQTQYMIDSGLPWCKITLPMFAGHVEGWALYAESLGEYKTPEARVAHMYYYLWRVARVVLDIGIHCRGWTVSQAEDYLQEHSLLDPSRVKKEVFRYIAQPGQASTYWIGYKAIMLCKANFSGRIQEFHDKLLRNGVQQLNTLLESFGIYL